ncbi:COG1470 family protein [Gemmiger sp.]|uniref:COG1470 family protein n=1 Tax=Gemmiger sp. TaxID=2049027 RepID=UPI003F0AF5D9
MQTQTESFPSPRKLLLALLAVVALTAALILPTRAEGGIVLSTKYPGITAKAGDTVSFDLDIANASGAGSIVELSVASMPSGWEGYFEGGGSEISRVYVKNGDSSGVVSFHLTIPAETTQGTYEVILQGGSTLTLTLDVSEEELGSSALTTQYAEQEGASGTEFTFSTTVQNNTPNEQSYSFSSNAPTGWTVSFKPSGESTQVAAVTVGARSSQAMSVTVTPPDDVAAGDYTVDISAISATETLTDTLTVTITGTYELELTTPSGRLSFDATANKKSSVTLSITNNGNVDLQNVNLTSSAPTDWVVEFSESEIPVLEAGATHEVTAYVTPAKDAMTGDYELTLTAKNSETKDSATFRVSVKTETIWGVVGVLLIVAAFGGLAWVFRKYGRR